MSSWMTYLYQKYSKKCLDNIHAIMKHKMQTSSKRDWRQPSVLGKCSTAKSCKSHDMHTLQQSSPHVPTHRMTSSSCSSPSPPQKSRCPNVAAPDSLWHKPLAWFWLHVVLRFFEKCTLAQDWLWTKPEQAEPPLICSYLYGCPIIIAMHLRS